jgi:hypothetical protein
MDGLIPVLAGAVSTVIYPPGRRRIVGSVFHLSDSDRYRRLNDVVCVCAGEVRAPDDPNRDSSDLVIDVAELIWEPIAE